jgi:hypothetical protein
MYFYDLGKKKSVEQALCAGAEKYSPNLISLFITLDS